MLPQVDALHRDRKPSIKTKRGTLKQNLNDKLKVSNAEILACNSHYAIQGHRFWYQSKADTQLPIID